LNYLLSNILKKFRKVGRYYGLLSYFEFHKDKQPVTYDDVESKTSYFYGKKAWRKRMIKWLWV